MIINPSPIQRVSVRDEALAILSRLGTPESAFPREGLIVFSPITGELITHLRITGPEEASGEPGDYGGRRASPSIADTAGHGGAGRGTARQARAELPVAFAVAVGAFTRPSALLLFLYTLGTALIGHRYWTTMTGADRVDGMDSFYKKFSIMGGFLLLYITGAGKY
jgi:hypothetical protein